MMTEEDITLEIPLWVYLLTVLAILITLGVAGYIYLGFLVTAPVMLAGFLALAAWYRTTYRQPRQRRILPLYIALTVVLLLQGAEQWYFEYPEVIKTLFPASFGPPLLVFNESIFMSVFVFGGTTLFLFAAVGIFFHHSLGNYMSWFMMIYAVIGGLLLLGWPLLAGQMQYLPGMVSAPPAILLGLMGISRLSQKAAMQGVLA